MPSPFEQLGDKQRYISLTTFRRDGRGVATPVWFVPDGERILVWTELSAGKAKRVRATGRVTVAPCDARGKITGASFEGRGRMLPEAEFAAHWRCWKARYRVMKPLFGAWDNVFRLISRKPQPAEVFMAITPDGAA